MSTKMIMLIGGLILAAVTLTVIYLYTANTCTVGGLAGVRCNCRGYMMLKSKESYPDGFGTYACIGIKN